MSTPGAGFDSCFGSRDQGVGGSRRQALCALDPTDFNRKRLEQDARPRRIALLKRIIHREAESAEMPANDAGRQRQGSALVDERGDLNLRWIVSLRRIRRICRRCAARHEQHHEC